MSYIKTVWEELPSTNTPINPSNLNKIEEGIYNNSLAIENAIESGSNSNGNYIKIADGTLIQYGLIDKTEYLNSETISSSSQGINFYRSNNPYQYFPLSFLDTNYKVSLLVNNGYNVGTRSLFTRIGGKYVNRFESQLIGFDGFRSDENDYTNLNYVEWIAIGRWK